MSILTKEKTVTEGIPPRDTPRFASLITFAKEQYAIYILIVLLIIGGLTTPAFFTTRNMSNLLIQVSVIGIVTLAELLVVITAGIDISVGSVVGLAAVLSAGLFSGSNVAVAVIIALGVGALVGLVNGLFIALRGIESFIVTLGMLSLARGIVYAYTEGIPVNPTSPHFRWVATTSVLGIPLLGIIWIIIAIAMALVLRRTVFGRRVFAVGSNKEAARASGIPVKSTLLFVYIIAGLLSGFSGFLLTAYVGSGTPTAGNLYELSAIAGVVIGGTRLTGGRGSVFGAVIGALIFAVINNLLVLLNVSTYFQDAFSGGLILVAVLITTFHFAKKRKEKDLVEPSATENKIDA